MQIMTKKAIQKLQDETGHVLVVEDFDLIEELDGLADGFSGVSSDESRLLYQPYSLCGIKFYPLTVAKSLWYQEKVKEWCIEGSLQESLLFWLMTLPNDAGELDHYAEEKEALKAIRKLSRRLHCTPEQLNDMFLKCVGNQSGDSDKAVDYGGVVAVLIREYGGKPDEWLYETPLPMITALFKAFERRIDAEEKTARASSGGKAVAPAPTRRMERLNDFRVKVNEIREAWNG